MIGRRRRALAAADRRRLVALLVVCTVAGVLDWLVPLGGRGRPITTVHAAVFAVIWTGITLVSQWLAAAAEFTVAYLASAVSWLAGRVANILFSTGAIFSKVWEGLRIVWADVLRPALAWVDGWIKRIHAWLVDTFKPVFDFLAEIRRRLLDFYRTFVRPVLDTIDFIRAINRVLLAFHITILQKLDSTLAAIEARIEEPFQFLLRQLTKVQNLIDTIVGLDGFFQRYTMVASLRKYAPIWMHNFWSDQIGPVRGRDGSYERTRDYPAHEALEDELALQDYFAGEGGTKAGRIEEGAALLAELLTPGITVFPPPELPS